MRLIFVLVAIAITAFPGLAANAKAGEEIYVRACKACHGADGRGNEVIAKALNAPQPYLGSVSDEAVKNAVINGKGKMKAITSVEGGEIRDLIAFIHTFPKK